MQSSRMSWDESFIAHDLSHRHALAPQSDFKFLPRTFAPLPNAGSPTRLDLCELCERIIPPRDLNPATARSLQLWHKQVLDLHEASQTCDFCRLIMYGFVLKGCTSELLDYICNRREVNLLLFFYRYESTHLPGSIIISCIARWWNR
jgi:hypothetical protein